jgi:toxin FitB
MYLVDTDVLSEARKGLQANPGVRAFFRSAGLQQTPLFLSVLTIGEVRRGVERVRHRGEESRARQLERWLELLMAEYEDRVLPIDADCAQAWGHLRVPHPENPIDKLIAATALIHGLTVVTRNAAHFHPTGVALLNPFEA